MARSRQTSARGKTRRLEVRGLRSQSEPVEVRAPALPWPLAVVLAAVGAAAAGWIIVAAPVVVASLTGPPRSIAGGLKLSTEFWLLGHGAGAVIGATTITLMPLGLTAILLLILSGLAGVAARQAVLAHESDDLPLEERQRLLSRLVLSFTGTYVLTVGIVAFLLTTPVQVAKSLVGAAILAGLSSLISVAKVVGWDAMRTWPSWAKRVPMAAGAGVATVVLGGSAALLVALYQGRGRITELSTSLGADPVGGFVLVLGELAYLPNLVLWGASWVLGAGISVGDGSVISPTVTQLGLLPVVPVFGAVPTESSGSRALMAWLIVGVAAGVVAAWTATAPRRRARFDETSLIGGLAGVVAGLAVTVVAVVSRGNLGMSRLVGIGPRPFELFVMACSLLGISGMAAGLVIGLLSRSGRTNWIAATAGPDDGNGGAEAATGGGPDEETAPVG
ncbi:MAG TPA: DUF6350 family protein [Propionibacteriaceae bacterium]